MSPPLDEEEEQEGKKFTVSQGVLSSKKYEGGWESAALEIANRELLPCRSFRSREHREVVPRIALKGKGKKGGEWGRAGYWQQMSKSDGCAARENDPAKQDGKGKCILTKSQRRKEAQKTTPTA